MILIISLSHRITRKLNLAQSFYWKVAWRRHNCCNVRMCERVCSFKKSFNLGSIERLLFLVKIALYQDPDLGVDLGTKKKILRFAATTERLKSRENSEQEMLLHLERQ